MRKGQRSREVCLEASLEANAKWNAEDRRLAGYDLQQLVDDTSTIDPELRKQLLYFCERGFVEDKPTGSLRNQHILLRRYEDPRSGAALKDPLEGVVTAETPTTVTTASGSLFGRAT